MSPRAPSTARRTRWPALLAALAICGLYFSLPEHLTFGPGWLLAAVSIALLIPTTIFHRKGHAELNEIFGYANLAVITLGLISSLVLAGDAVAPAQGSAGGVAAGGFFALGGEYPGVCVVGTGDWMAAVRTSATSRRLMRTGRSCSRRW